MQMCFINMTNMDGVGDMTSGMLWKMEMIQFSHHAINLLQLLSKTSVSYMRMVMDVKPHVTGNTKVIHSLWLTHTHWRCIFVAHCPDLIIKATFI